MDINGKIIKVSVSNLSRICQSDSININDMAAVSPINTKDLLTNIKNRYNENEEKTEKNYLRFFKKFETKISDSAINLNSKKYKKKDSTNEINNYINYKINSNKEEKEEK